MEKNRNESHISTRNLVITALLIALAMIIPMYFGFLRVVVPPFFTATIASHVPQFIAMMISPVVAVAVGAGSALGFFLAGYGPVVALRATSHIVWGLMGALMIKKEHKHLTAGKLITIILLTGVVHGVYEGLVIIPFLAQKGTLTFAAIGVTGFGTFLHHLVDAAIAVPIASALHLLPRNLFSKKRA